MSEHPASSKVLEPYGKSKNSPFQFYKQTQTGANNMNISDILGAVVQSGMTPSSNDRIKNSLGGGNVLDSLGSMLGGGASTPGAGGSLGDMLGGILGGGRGGAGGGIGDMLSGMLGSAGQAVGGNQNLAVGGLGALVGALLGGGGKSVGGAVGGGVMAVLASMAFKALAGGGGQQAQVPVGLLEPQTASERQELENKSGIILRAMINAAKADGQIDQNEMDRILGKLKEAGIDEEGQRYVTDQMQTPAETDQLIAAAQGEPQLAAQIYAASLLAIEVDTQAERDYLNQLAGGMGLSAQVVSRIEEMAGLQPA
jgi:uncharacterized membrane protein YebE (DUF533 family)